MLLTGRNIFKPYQNETLTDIYSPVLKRLVTVDILYPSSYSVSKKKYPVLVLNDGQDNEKVRLKSTLSRLARSNQIEEILVIGVHAGERLQEYGIASQADFKKRGSKARQYSIFIVEELLPMLAAAFRIDLHHPHNAIAGYSLGGLSAFDIGWNHSEIFRKIGSFSGSFWWRSKSYADGYSDDLHRLMHLQIRKDTFRQGLKFWFQTGSHDERADRNNNGVIDSIDDTLDLIAELTKKGYRPFYDIQYVEIKNGLHNQKTWARAMPEFLKWAFGN